MEAPTTNVFGVRAHALDPHAALAQYALTGCLGASWYANATLVPERTVRQHSLTEAYDVSDKDHDFKAKQSRSVLTLALKAEPAFLAKLAVFARKRGFRKDLPAFLCAVLAARGRTYLEEVFALAIDNERMLRGFVGFLRSGIVGRRSLGSWPRRLVRAWLEARTDEQLFRGSVGQNPSLAEVIHLAHPHPATPSRRALYGYLLKKPHCFDELPALVQQFEFFRRSGGEGEPPAVPFLLLANMKLGPHAWCRLAQDMGWHALRMNLRTLAKHKVFTRRLPPARGEVGLIAAAPRRSRPRMTDFLAEKLADREAIARSRVLPFQVLATWKTLHHELPTVLSNALHTALERSLENVP